MTDTSGPPTPMYYVERLKSTENIESDYKVSERIGVSRQLISNWRHGRATMDAYHCWKLADALGLDEREIEAAVNYHRERDITKRIYWGTKWLALQAFAFASSEAAGTSPPLPCHSDTVTTRECNTP